MLKKLRYGATFPLLLVTSLVLNTATAGATPGGMTTGAGVITGNVRVVPGIPGSPWDLCVATTYTFLGTAAGRIDHVDATPFAHAAAAFGLFNARARGGSAHECNQSAGGSVLVFLRRVSTGIGTVRLCVNLLGAYVRVGVVAVLDMVGQLLVNSPVGFGGSDGCHWVDLTIAALLVPTLVPGKGRPITNVAFTGVWDLLGLDA